ncbi:hypothetical protein, partial [Paractinoplanes toevensis]|uniref:hypothetical protein n=1 Tax=Paractinoplanes toevensis TaxID=571911 RepID=UPI001BB31A8E
MAPTETFVDPESVLAQTAREMLATHAGGAGPSEGMTECPVCGEPLPCPAGRSAAEVLEAAGLAEASGLISVHRQGLPGPAAYEEEQAYASPLAFGSPPDVPAETYDGPAWNGPSAGTPYLDSSPVEVSFAPAEPSLMPEPPRYKPPVPTGLSFDLPPVENPAPATDPGRDDEPRLSGMTVASLSQHDDLRGTPPPEPIGPAGLRPGPLPPAGPPDPSTAGWSTHAESSWSTQPDPAGSALAAPAGSRRPSAFSAQSDPSGPGWSSTQSETSGSGLSAAGAWPSALAEQSGSALAAQAGPSDPGWLPTQPESFGSSLAARAGSADWPSGQAEPPASGLSGRPGPSSADRSSAEASGSA